MANGITHPGVYVEELPGGVRPIAGVSTSTTAFVGTATQGIVNRAIAIQTFGEFETGFGGLDRQSHMGHAVRQFFLNGGKDAIIVRVPTHDETDDLPRVFLGDRSRGQGLYALDSVDIFNLLCLPGIADPTVLAAAAAFCRERRAFLIVDAPSTVVTPDDMLAFVDGPSLPRTDHAGLYYPWIDVPDPLDHDAPRPAPPSGTIAGLFARTDAARGVWKAPAGTAAQLMNVVGIARRITEEENGRLNRRAVNCLRVFPELGPVCWGARTLLGDDQQGSEWKYVPVRRLALYIEESIDRGLAWIVFEPNDEPLWARIRASVGAFMHRLFVQGAFQGVTPREAYLVRCDATTTSQADINAGVVNIVVGFAPLKPAEFLILTIRHRTGEVAPAATELERVPAAGTFSELALPDAARQQLRELMTRVRDQRLGAVVVFTGSDRAAHTTAAEGIASELACDLYRVDLRRVVSKYIGETEKNLDRILNAAEVVGGVLLFDEADALFGRRTDVHDSHDRYASRGIDYLLQRIGSSPRLVVLATRATQDLDAALLRRLHCIDLTG
jgi:phage tail sheath protein FI